ncbi:MAG TPA: ASCH domain-containing protein [Polyangiaceae bacterium]|nr:ASCH domain-containing protein [Polyangiaceae bacterium]
MLLVLTPSHRVFLDDAGRAPRLPVGPRRPLLEARDALPPAVASVLPPPCGSRYGALAFVVASAPPGRFAPLAAALTGPDGDAIFDAYTDLLLGGWTPPTRDLDVFAFGDSPALAARLGHLVIKGNKRASAGWLRAAETSGETVPQPGLVSIVTDGFGHPLCAIETERVERLPFDEVPAELAALEGEGDRSLEDWREGHLAYFTREAASLGLTFSPREVLFFETFRLLTVFGRRG